MLQCLNSATQMRSQHNHCHVQVREGVELWELGETLGGPESAITSVPDHSARTHTHAHGSETSSSSSGSSCSSTSLRRTPIHGALVRPSEGPSPHAPWVEGVGGTHFDEEEGEGELMSLRARDPPFGSLRGGLTRSRSFGGLLMTPNSGRRSIGSATLRTGWAGMGVLGQGIPPSPRDIRRMSSLPPHVKVPKTPRPQRASLVAGAVAKGVRDCVAVTRKDLFALTRAQQDYRKAKSQGRVYEMEKQMKAAERYLKRLEFLLSQVEDLYDQYSLNQRLRDGVRTMAYAYALSPGKDKASALNNVRSGYRECTETLCNLEVQIEQLIGTFTIEMKGIQGFARLCPGDVFEVSIKHGSQKWKTKGRVAKDTSQLWDNPVYVFKALVGEMLLIKATEVRLLGKTVMIGNKMCETKDLFSPHPQLMTVNLNSSGSLKLNVAITWNPLDGGSEDTLVRTPSISGPSPRGHRKSIIHSLSSSPPQEKPIGSSIKEIISPECDQDSSFGSMSARSSTADSASPLSEYRGIPSSQALSTRTSSNSPVSDIQALGLSRRIDSHDSISFDGRDSASPMCDDAGNFTLVRKEESRVEQWARYSQYEAPFNASQASSIDIMSRSFPNLAPSHSPHSHSPHSHSPHSPAPASAPSQAQLLSQSLSHQLNLLTVAEQENNKWSDPQAWDCTVPSSLPKVVSRLRTCLEDIQGQFPQLHSLEEAVLDLYDMCKQCRSRRDSNTSEISLSVESALECFDFLNAECDDDFADDNPEECLAKNRKESLAALNGKDFTEPPPPLVTGSPQLDAFLLIHLQHSLHLIQDLGSFGPLRRKESESLVKLEAEGKLLEIVLSHKHNFDSLRPQHIMPVPHVQVLWDSVTCSEDWCVTGKDVIKGLSSVVSSLVEPDEEELPEKVLQELVRRMTDSEIYSDCLTVTAGHFLAHLMKPLQETVPEIAASLNCSTALSRRDPHSVEKGLSLLKRPNITHTRLIAQHFLGPKEFSSLIETYLNNSNEETLCSLFDNCLLLLESTNPTDRSSSATLLGQLLQCYVPKKVDKNANDSVRSVSTRKIDAEKPSSENANDGDAQRESANGTTAKKEDDDGGETRTNEAKNEKTSHTEGDVNAGEAKENDIDEKTNHTEGDVNLTAGIGKGNAKEEKNDQTGDVNSTEGKGNGIERNDNDEKTNNTEGDVNVREGERKDKEERNAKDEKNEKTESDVNTRAGEGNRKDERHVKNEKPDKTDVNSAEGKGKEERNAKDEKTDVNSRDGEGKKKRNGSIEMPLPQKCMSSLYASGSHIKNNSNQARPIAILSFLQQNDPSQEVRNSARLALLNLGTQGQEALHQVQLSSHGFQGVYVKDGKVKT